MEGKKRDKGRIDGEREREIVAEQENEKENEIKKQIHFIKV